MNLKKLKVIIELVLLGLILVGIVILIKEYSTLNNLMKYLSEGNIDPIVEYYGNSTGQMCTMLCVPY